MVCKQHKNKRAQKQDLFLKIKKTNKKALMSILFMSFNEMNLLAMIRFGHNICPIKGAS